MTFFLLQNSKDITLKKLVTKLFWFPLILIAIFFSPIMQINGNQLVTIWFRGYRFGMTWRWVNDDRIFILSRLSLWQSTQKNNTVKLKSLTEQKKKLTFAAKGTWYLPTSQKEIWDMIILFIYLSFFYFYALNTTDILINYVVLLYNKIRFVLSLSWRS